MSIESQDDWAGLRAVSEVARDTLALLAREVRPGVATGDIDALAKDLFQSRGARSAPAIVYGFPGTVLISINNEVVHGVPGRRRIQPSDLVSLDVTVELNGYVADAARSLVVPPGTDTAHRLVTCAKVSFDAALSVAKAGVPVREIGRAVQREVHRAGFAVVRGLSGHGVGRTIHEPPEVPNESGSHTDGRLDGRVGYHNRTHGGRRLGSRSDRGGRLDDFHERRQLGCALRRHDCHHSWAACGAYRSGGITRAAPAGRSARVRPLVSTTVRQTRRQGR